MTKDDLEKLGIGVPEDTPSQTEEQLQAMNQVVVALSDAVSALNEFIPTLEGLRTTFRATSTVPSYIPRTFLEQFVLYESGATRRLYVYVGTAWRYVVLT